MSEQSEAEKCISYFEKRKQKYINMHNKRTLTYIKTSLSAS